MKIAVWNSESDSIESFMDTAESFSELVIFDALDDFLEEEEEEDFDLLVVDYDSDKKAVDKFIKTLRKEEVETKVLLLSNILTPKQLVKHQSSKSGADIYLRTPLTKDLLQSIFEPFFDIKIESESKSKDEVSDVHQAKLSKHDQTMQTRILQDHSVDSEISQEAKELSDVIEEKFKVVFSEEESHAAKMLAEIEEKEQNEQLSPNEISLEDDEEDEISLGDDDIEEELSLGEDDDEELLLGEDDDEELSLGEDDDEELSLGEENIEEELSLDAENIEDEAPDESTRLDTASVEPPPLEDLELADGNEEGMTVAVEQKDEVALEEVEGEALDFAEGGDDQIIAVVETQDNVALEEVDGEALDFAQGADAETIAVVETQDNVALEEVEGEALDFAEGGDIETIAVVETQDNVALEEVEGEAIGFAESADAETVVAVESKDEIELAQDSDEAIELSADGDAPENIAIVTDEIDLSAEAKPTPAPAKQEEKVMATEDDENTLDIGGDEDILDIGGDDESLDLLADIDEGDDLDLGVDDDMLEIGGEDDSLDVDADLGEEESLDLGSDEEMLEIGMEEDSLEMSAQEDEVEALDLGEEDSLELGGEDDIEMDGDDLNLEQVDDIDDDAVADLEFGSGEDLDETDTDLSALDLPEAPDVTDADLSFDSESKGDHSDDVMAKLAEIDAMMDDSTPIMGTQNEATGEHEFTPEGHAESQLAEIDEMTEVLPVEKNDEATNPAMDMEEAQDLSDTLSALTGDSGFENIEFTNSNDVEALESVNEVEDFSEDDLSFGTGEEELASGPPPAEPPAEPEMLTPAVSTPPPAAPSSVGASEHNAYMQHHSEELTRYGESIKNLREEREYLLAQIQKLQENNENLKRDKNSLKAQLDEKKIELTIVKKRHEKEMDEIKYQLDVSNDRREVLEEKNRQFEKEYENLNRKVKVDITKVRSRERDLENKLEMLRADAEMQIRNRDQKILELKRKIDTLQFDVENIQVQERKVVTNNHQLEDKMQKVIRSLRRAIGELEEDGSSIRSIEEIKKNLDV